MLVYWLVCRVSRYGGQKNYEAKKLAWCNHNADRDKADADGIADVSEIVTLIAFPDER